MHISHQYTIIVTNLSSHKVDMIIFSKKVEDKRVPLLLPHKQPLERKLCKKEERILTIEGAHLVELCDTKGVIISTL
jgi:hypothetical protein